LYLNGVLLQWHYAILVVVLCLLLGVFLFLVKRDNFLLHRAFDGDAKAIAEKESDIKAEYDHHSHSSEHDDDQDDDQDDDINNLTSGSRRKRSKRASADPDALGDVFDDSTSNRRSPGRIATAVNTAAVVQISSSQQTPASVSVAAVSPRRSRHLSADLADDVHGTTSNATNDDTSVSATPTWSAMPPIDQDHTLSNDETDEPSLSVTPPPQPPTTTTTTTSAAVAASTFSLHSNAPGPLAFVAPPQTSYTEFDFRVSPAHMADAFSTIQALFAVDSSSIEERANQCYVLRLPKANVEVMGGVYGVTSTLTAIGGIWHAEEIINPANIVGSAGDSSGSDTPIDDGVNRPHDTPERQRRRLARNQALAAAQAAKSAPSLPSVTHISHRTFMPKGWSRADLETLFHRDFTAFDAYSAVFLGMATLGMGMSCLLLLGNWSVLLCFGIAGAVFSLLKMPSPDGGSVVLSGTESARGRAVYILLLGSVLWITFAGSTQLGNHSFTVWYGVRVYGGRILATVHDVTLVLLCILPILVTLGVLPTRPSTLALFIFEQIDRTIFGASASSTTTGAILSLLQGAFIVGISFVIGGYGSVLPPLNLWHRAAVVGVLFALTYAKSRWPNDLKQLWPATLALLRVAARVFHRPASSKKSSGVVDDHDASKRTKASGAATPATKVAPSATGAASAAAATSIDPDSYPADRLLRDLRHMLLIFLVTFAVQVVLGIDPVAVAGGTTVMSGLVVAFSIVCEISLELRRRYPLGIVGMSIFRDDSVVTDFMPRGRRSTITKPQMVSAWLNAILRDALWPLWLMVAGIEAHTALLKHGAAPSLVLTLLAMHSLLRRVWTMPHNLVPVLALVAAQLVLKFDLRSLEPEAPLLDTWIAAVVVERLCEFCLKLHFVAVYVLRSWISPDIGPKFFAIPHSMLFTVELIASCVLSVPLMPLAGMGVFVLSYARPIKYWEVEYKTKFRGAPTQRMDRLGVDTDSENSNSVFYEHLLKGMRATIVGHVQAGRFGRVSPGDVFLLINESLTVIVHFVELGNGHVSFQLRGLEFGGTYCQRQELLGISELVDSAPSFLLRPHRALLRTWTVENREVLLPSYSLAFLPAAPLFSAYGYREAFVTALVRAVIYCLCEAEDGRAIERWTRVPELTRGLSIDTVIREAMAGEYIDSDFDKERHGITLVSFHARYGAWLEYCLKQRDDTLDATAKREAAAAAPVPRHTTDNDDASLHSAFTDASDNDDATSDPDIDSAQAGAADGAAAAPTPRMVTSDACGVTSTVVRLALLTTVFARRVVWPSSTDRTDSTLFVARLRAALAGDLRLCSSQDEWAMTHIDELMAVVRRALRFALQLHLDHVQNGPEEYDDPETLYDALELFEPKGGQYCICDEADPQWRDAVVNEVPNLVSMRTVHLPRTIEYYVTRGELGVGRFSVVRVNRESVRALWAAQQHELLYLINGDAERGSIQQMRPCLRNVINQSCDAPVGYPIFVAPIASAFGGELMRELYATKPPAPAKNPRRFARDDIDVEMRQMRGPARTPASMEAQRQRARPLRRALDDWIL
jgi:hypothetical protein